MFPHFDTQRLSARPITLQSDSVDTLAQDTLALLTPAVQDALPGHWPAVTNVSEAQSWLQARTEESMLLAVRRLSDGQLVGFLILSPTVLVQVGTSWHLGYLLGEAHWRQGLASELVQGLMAWCQQHQQVACLRAGVSKDHPSSARVLQKCGFSEIALPEGPEGVQFYEYHFHTPAGAN
ncbi:GNAT family N-acetyltransferase [Ferrimonas balearica]|uniref:GNAT family N-acetyltransferase n=1 Tax=Ferrimonas balearica TaxID=44012 RepID=UPI001C969FCB|nr:GNAT family N-acetyltransferase [Ferrimonas balearica]MBY6223802.1 GNAT family N-acetyltransferase [Ferrimonas balearica]